jgi:two-component system NtrC family sensor kinase
LEEYADSLEVKVETRSRELKASQQQLIHSEKMASVGLLAAGVAHEINNPTGFVMSNLEVLRGYKINLQKLFLGYQELTSYVAEGNTDSNREEIKASLQKLKVIEEEGDIQYIMEDLDSLLDDSLLGTQRIQKIVQDLKSFSRVDDSEKKFVDLNEEVIEIALRLVWNEIKYKCTLKKELMPLPRFECRPGQLSQVIMNLLINASDAIETNGEITLSSECADSMIIIKVTDDGMGIAQKEMLNIFDPFFTTKESGKGTGLGLSISHDIVKKHTGEILVSSELGEGTTFSIHLPLNPSSRDYTGRQTEWKA